MNLRESPLPACPAPLAALLARLPAWPPSAVLSAALNAMLLPRLDGDVRAALEGKHLRIEIRDARVRMDFTYRDRRFTALRSASSTPDLAIGATAADFVRLARREADADMLFFSRRLSMQGDTELGVLVKNTLDQLEVPVFQSWRRRSP